MSEEYDFKKITIVGTGLIGGSIGMALKKSHYSGQVFGVDKPEIIKKAIACDAIDQGSQQMAEGVENADMVVLAMPVKEIMKSLVRLKPLLSQQCLVTDTGSTKEDIMNEAKQVFSNQYSFIGGHPIAGSEKEGIEHATPDLFRGKPYIVVPANNNNNSDLKNRLAISKMAYFIHHIGAVKVEMEAAEHDRVLALVSHLPQLIAVMMANMLGSLAKEKNEEKYFRICGNVFNEITRVASSPFSIWENIYQTNGKWTISFIDELKDLLEKSKQKIVSDPSKLAEDFSKSNYFKEKMIQISDD